MRSLVERYGEKEQRTRTYTTYNRRDNQITHTHTHICIEETHTTRQDATRVYREGSNTRHVRSFPVIFLFNVAFSECIRSDYFLRSVFLSHLFLLVFSLSPPPPPSFHARISRSSSTFFFDSTPVSSVTIRVASKPKWKWPLARNVSLCFAFLPIKSRSNSCVSMFPFQSGSFQSCFSAISI